MHLNFDKIFFGKYSSHKIMKIEESSRENTDTKLIRIEKSPLEIILISLIFGAWGIF